MSGLKDWPDDFVIVTTSDFSPGQCTLRVSTAQHAFNLILQSHDHLWTITRDGQTFNRRQIFEAAVAEGMEPDVRIRPPFDFQKALRDRAARQQ